MSRRRPIVTAVALGVLFAACAGGTVDDATPSPTVQLGQEPDVPIPTGEPPPTELTVQDLVPGEGREATLGTTLQVHYVGKTWSTGTTFESTWNRAPFTFDLGSGAVIAGWDEGLVGMREGGRRRLVIPPDLAYADEPPPGIAPGATLVFVVDLLSVTT